MWWFLYGLLVGAGGLRLILWTSEGKLSAGWYAWPLGALALALAALTAQHFFASHREMEPRAAWMGLLMMGVPTLILGGIVFWMFLP